MRFDIDTLGDGVTDGIEDRFRLPRGSHLDILGQPGGDRGRKNLRIEFLWGKEGGDLSLCMDTGVRPGRAQHVDGFSHQLLDRRFHHLLNGSKRFRIRRMLLLPSMEIGSVVGDVQCITAHGRQTRSIRRRRRSMPEEISRGEHALVLEVLECIVDGREDLRGGLGDEG